MAAGRKEAVLRKKLMPTGHKYRAVRWLWHDVNAVLCMHLSVFPLSEIFDRMHILDLFSWMLCMWTFGSLEISVISSPLTYCSCIIFYILTYFYSLRIRKSITYESYFLRQHWESQVLFCANALQIKITRLTAGNTSLVEIRNVVFSWKHSSTQGVASLWLPPQSHFAEFPSPPPS